MLYALLCEVDVSEEHNNHCAAYFSTVKDVCLSAIRSNCGVNMSSFKSKPQWKALRSHDGQCSKLRSPRIKLTPLSWTFSPPLGGSGLVRECGARFTFTPSFDWFNLHSWSGECSEDRNCWEHKNQLTHSLLAVKRNINKHNSGRSETSVAGT